jgi:hypothetical protein
VFDTVLWIGRFIEAWHGGYRLICRRQVKLHLCESARANDANIRAALIDRFGPGKDKAVGSKGTPGPALWLGGRDRNVLAIVDGARARERVSTSSGGRATVPADRVSRITDATE